MMVHMRILFVCLCLVLLVPACAGAGVVVGALLDAWWALALGLVGGNAVLFGVFYFSIDWMRAQSKASPGSRSPSGPHRAMGFTS
jgi:hypothetical protein